MSQADLILVTHCHFDHIGDLIQTARDTAAPVVAIAELSRWLEEKGPAAAATDELRVGLFGVGAIQITMVPAEHSSGWVENGTMVYMGEPVYFVLTLEDGRRLYFGCDTAVFGDMRLI